MVSHALVRPDCQPGRRKREPGGNPGLPRSGEWERKPSTSTGPLERPREATAGRRSEEHAHESEDLPIAFGPRPRGTAPPGALVPARLGEVREERTRMRIKKRDGSLEPVDVTRIVRAVESCSGGLADVEPLRVATRTISGLYDGATTAELDRLSIQTAAEMIGEEPQYSRLAARLLAAYIHKEVERRLVQPVDQGRPRPRPDRRPHGRLRGRPRRPARRRDRPSQRSPLRILRPPNRVRPLPAPPPPDPPSRGDPAVLAPPGRLRPGPDPPTRRSSSTG